MSEPVVTLITATGDGAWECPVGVTEIMVECWGPGGGGATVGGVGSPGSWFAGGGGGGGAYARRDVVPVVPESVYNYHVGAGSSGNDTLFTAGAVVVRGRAGANVAAQQTAGEQGGQATSADGTTYYNGGGGGAGGGEVPSGGGGGGAGSGSAGGNASGWTAGAAGTPDGGAGAQGRQATTYSNGSPGTAPGGGGSGAVASGLESRTGGAGARGQIRITYNLPRPGVPTISSPTDLSGAAPGAIVALTATATEPTGQQVRYRWYYNSGSGDNLIGETALVSSGSPGTYNWDTTGLALGIYTLKCWAVDEDDDASSTYATVTIYLADAVLTAPTAGSSYVAGTMTITGRGYLVGSGSVRLQVEIDTHDPPDDESEDYDLITSALVSQGEDVSVIGNITHLGTWYLRVRAWDETAETASDWTDVRLVYVLEGLRLLSGSKVELSTLAVYNRVYAVVKGSDPPIVGVATNTTVSPTYAESPREMWVEVPEGSDQTTADAIAAAKLALLQEERITLSGLKVSLADGLKLQRGQRVGVQIDRLGLNLTLPVRELSFDLAAATCDVVLGDFWEPRTDQDAQMALAQKVQQMQKEAAA